MYNTEGCVTSSIRDNLERLICTSSLNDNELTWDNIVSKHEAPDSSGHGSNVRGGVPQAEHSRQLLLEVLLSDTCMHHAHQLGTLNMIAKVYNLAMLCML